MSYMCEILSCLVFFFSGFPSHSHSLSLSHTLPYILTHTHAAPYTYSMREQPLDSVRERPPDSMRERPLDGVRERPLDIPKDASSYRPTTVTSTTEAAAESQPSPELLVVKILQGELVRKMAHLQDVHNAYIHLAGHWTEEKNYEAQAIHQHGYLVQRCWLRAEKTWNFRDRLDNAVDQLEKEIQEIRVELQDLAKAIGGRH